MSTATQPRAARRPQRDGPYRVGLTGGIASGKSTVGRLFADAGFRVIDADRVVADLYQPGGAGTAAVATLLGDEFLDPSGAVDTAAVAGRVFSDAPLRHELEAVIHPLVRRRFADLAATPDGAAATETSRVVVLEATLLVEAGYAPDFDLVVTVEASAEIRFARAVARGADPADARARMAAQGDGAARRAGANRQILNNGSPEGLATVVAGLVDEIRRRAGGDA